MCTLCTCAVLMFGNQKFLGKLLDEFTVADRRIASSGSN